ncbi:hypothetical protein SAMN05216567_103221 [Variovorax sp. OK605]|jgi:hypothetical protein|uniref:hypothetical protein n=1 Tax=Variovorax sp. OK605 TaxID=1855317 RepID=UPI0008F34BD9|nr:hypothetical protein [Variovorax sp. OK605]SFO89464.1 hypothetical protein SAMN05216567_103221 [Variovorax sp. OK605]
MSFKKYLEEKYPIACDMQRQIDEDPLMVDMLRTNGADHELVKKWMRNYGLFQGIEGDSRNKIAKRFLTFALQHRRITRVNDATVADLYRELLTALFKVKSRSWMSATSKLLWCLYPRDIVIYDAFVHRALVTLQCVDPDLAGTERIGAAPMIKALADIDPAVATYMRYQGLVRKLLTVHTPALTELRRKHKEQYQYDIRIVDKLLWMIGDSKRAY